MPLRDVINGQHHQSVEASFDSNNVFSGEQIPFTTANASQVNQFQSSIRLNHCLRQLVTECR